MPGKIALADLSGAFLDQLARDLATLTRALPDAQVKECAARVRNAITEELNRRD